MQHSNAAMNAKELLILNFEEIRRRSIRVWKAISEEHLHWKPDADAMSCIEMIRHVLETEIAYQHIIPAPRCPCRFYKSIGR